MADSVILVDAGSGNLRSVRKALESLGARVTLTDDPTVVSGGEKVVLPGVGAFGDYMEGLQTRGLTEALEEVIRRGIPTLGICVGMQALFGESEEHGRHAGLGFLPGRVRRFEVEGLKVPQTGWNQLFPEKGTPLLEGLEPGAYVYFNHGYYCDAAEEDILAATEYGVRYASAVGRGRLYGVQFHPEKSQRVGLTILRNFVERC